LLEFKDIEINSIYAPAPPILLLIIQKNSRLSRGLIRGSWRVCVPVHVPCMFAVGEGKSNRQIADLYDISEPTVKGHLTSIFKTLELNDRVDLVLYLKQA
jgi:hypothetical protein